MILRRLTLEKYGAFRERISFDLSPRTKYGRSLPLVLIGGKNGAGKTTILTAISLALYGPLGLGKGTTRATYEAVLRKRINRASQPSPIAPTTVELEFEYAVAGRRHIYNVTRSWYEADGEVKELIELRRNGELLDEVGRDQWSDFVRELVPFGVSRLFFFDGEKIQELAEDDTDSTHFREALTSLLNLDLVDGLKADLTVYLKRERARQASAEVRSTLDKMSSEKEAAIAAIDSLKAKIAEHRTRLDALQTKKRRVEERISSQGGQFAEKRTELMGRRDEVSAELVMCESRLRELSQGLLPLALAPGLCSQVMTQLKADGIRTLGGQAGQMAAEVILTWSSDKALVNLDVKGDSSLLKEMRRILVRIADELVHKRSGANSSEAIHDLSPSQQLEVTTSLHAAITQVPLEVASVHRQMETLARKQRSVQVILDKAPAEDALADLLRQSSDINQEIGARDQHIRRIEDELATADRGLADLERKTSKLIDHIETDEDLAKRIKIAEGVKEALTGFRETLANKRVSRLQQLATEMYQRLARKKDVVRQIKIAPGTFEVTLVDRHNRTIPRQGLSAGEKQIYAISMLWALGKVSGRPLPIVIDTPLGRLDSDHRQNLVDHYFPAASHQVIILSTDTEIDESYTELLKPHLARTYHLDYSSETEDTTIQEGYFWNPVATKV